VWALGSARAPLAAAATALGIALLALQQIVGDAGAMVYQITDRTLRQTRAPEEFLARVDAGIHTLGYGATLAGALISGSLAEIFGARALLFTSSALIGGAALPPCCARSPLPQLSDRPRVAAARDFLPRGWHKHGNYFSLRTGKRGRGAATNHRVPNRNPQGSRQGAQPSTQPVHSRSTP
jgi:hypothetical protein